MRTSRTPSVRVKRNWNFSDFRAMETGLDNHFGSKFHSRAPLIKHVESVFPETPQPAVNIVQGRFEPFPSQKREHWIAPHAVQERHCPRLDYSTAGRQATALYEV